MSNINIPANHPYHTYVEQQGIENLSPISFIQFHRFKHSQKNFASQEYRRLISIIMQQHPKKGRRLMEELNAHKQVIAQHWEDTLEQEKQLTHASAVKDQGRVQSLAAVKAVTGDSLRVFGSPAFEDPENNPFFVQAREPSSIDYSTSAETEIEDEVVKQSGLRSGKRGRMPSGVSWTMRAGGNDDSGSPGQLMQASTSDPPTPDPGFPDPTLNLDHFTTLNQPVKWTVEGVDLVQKFQKFRAENLHDFSLARDGIADLSVSSKFRKSLGPDIGKAASRLSQVGDLQATWPTLTNILDRVFAKHHYDDVADAITNENMKDPVARYIIAHYFTFHDQVPTHINERQGFADLTWPFIRGAMTMAGVETQYLEVLIAGVLERKNLDKDDLTEAKQAGQYADGIAFWEDNQIFLSEASTIHSPKAEKLRQDEFKLARALRDSWISQLRSTCKHSVPLSGMAVFGSSTFKDETKLWRLDFGGVFRLVHFNSFFVPLKKGEFGKKAKVSILRCLELALRVKAEVDARENDADPVDHEMRELLEEAVPAIQSTSATPVKSRKRKS
ncbi:hypothetical protein BGZ98_006903 [Dissophora globulifera]|nr:hypothetical protein BGZ98_006903 [Dissophora globulifera]